MSAESALRTVLLAAAPVVALAGSRIASDRAEEGWPRPFVVFSRTGTEMHTDLDNVALAATATVELQIWADTRAAAELLSDACQAAVEAAGEAVISRSSAYDPDLDVEGTILIVEWWED